MLYLSHFYIYKSVNLRRPPSWADLYSFIEHGSLFLDSHVLLCLSLPPRYEPAPFFLLYFYYWPQLCFLPWLLLSMGPALEDHVGIHFQGFLKSRSCLEIWPQTFCTQSVQTPWSAPLTPSIGLLGASSGHSPYCCFHRFPHGCWEGVDLSSQQLVFRLGGDTLLFHFIVNVVNGYSSLII